MIRKEARACRKAAINENCRVCQDSAHGFHFGVMCCRACAAFFRRTIALNMSYHCRFEQKCEIDKSIRCMCRSCRHIKCIAVGMKAESVQLNRDTIGKQSKPKSTTTTTKAKKELSADTAYQPSLPLTLTPTSDQTPTPPSTSPLGSAGFSSNGSVPNTSQNYDEAEWEISNKLNIIFEDAFLNPRTSTDLSIIEQFQIGYRHLCTKRPMIHQTRFIDFTDEMLRNLPEAEIDRIFLANWESLIKQHEVEIDLLAELMSFIRPFVELPKDQRWLLFKNFWLHFAKFERAYDTYRVLGDNPDDKRIIFYNGQTMNFFGLIFGDNTEHPNINIDRYRQNYGFFRAAHILMKKGVVQTLKRIKPTEIEFCVLCLHLMFLHPGIEHISDETVEVGNFWRQQAFQEVHDYYIRELFLTNYAARLGEFMSLMSMVEKNSIQKRENYRIAEVFSLIKLSPLLMTFYRDS